MASSKKQSQPGALEGRKVGAWPSQDEGGFPLPLLPIPQGGFKNLVRFKILSLCSNYSLKCRMQFYNTSVCYFGPSVQFQLNWSEELIS